LDTDKVLADAAEERDTTKTPEAIVNTVLLTYYDAPDQPMRGAPIREGQLWLLSAEEEVEPVTMSLYINGVSFTHQGREVAVAFSPFSLVRNCKFQSNELAGGTQLSAFKCFKVSLFTQGICFYYGVRGETDDEAEEERSRWVFDIARAMRLVTQSLFPPRGISCEPLGTVMSTHTRLIAGYLVHHDGCTMASVLWAELHPQTSDGVAKMVLYENELCISPVCDIIITDRVSCCEKVGINCSCFTLADHHFSSRSLPERKLWLRAISNIKVKLQNRAPSPTDEELGHYRLAIQEHVQSIEEINQTQAPFDALLRRHPRLADAASATDADAPPAFPDHMFPMENDAGFDVDIGKEAPATSGGTGETIGGPDVPVVAG
jgi:hypothetical protein